MPEFCEEDGEDELQPEMEIKLAANNNVIRAVRFRVRLVRHARRGNKVRQRMLAQAILCNGSPKPRRCAEVGAVVETAMTEEACGPFAWGLSVAGENVQFSPAVRPLQERLIVP